jgi:hypothetical protein
MSAADISFAFDVFLIVHCPSATSLIFVSPTRPPLPKNLNPLAGELRRTFFCVPQVQKRGRLTDCWKRCIRCFRQNALQRCVAYSSARTSKRKRRQTLSERSWKKPNRPCWMCKSGLASLRALVLRSRDCPRHSFTGRGDLFDRWQSQNNEEHGHCRHDNHDPQTSQRIDR